MSEVTIQAAVQDTLQAMAAFAAADIVINDWSILDSSTFAAPYVIIRTADSVTSRQDTMTPNTRWQIPVTLFEAVHGLGRDVQQSAGPAASHH